MRPVAGAPGRAWQDSELRHGGHAFGFRFGTGRRALLGAPDAATDLGHRAACALSPGIPGLRALPRLLRALACAPAVELCRAVQRSDLRARRGQYVDLPGHRHQSEDADRAVPVRLLRAGAQMDPMAVGALHPALGGAVDPD